MHTLPDKDTETQLFPLANSGIRIAGSPSQMAAIPSQGLASKDAQAVGAPMRTRRSHSKGGGIVT